MRIKYDRRIEGKNAWLDANAVEDSPSLPLLLQLLQVQLVLPYGTGDQALLAMAAALYESDIMLLPSVEPGTVQVRYDATAAASLFADAPSGEVGIVWIEASKLDSPQSLSLDTPEATHYPLQLQGDSMSFKGLPYRHYMDDSMEVADKTVLYYCRCYFRASSTAEPLYDTVHSFSVQGLADNAYVYDRRYAADPFVLYPWLSDSFREAHGIGPIGYIAVEDTYSSRETADGADIIDGALETVKKIQGATVKPIQKNQFNILAVDTYGGSTTANTIKVNTATGVLTIPSSETITRASMLTLGKLSSLIPNASIGETYTIFATYSGLDGNSISGSIEISNGSRMLLQPRGVDGSYKSTFTIESGDIGSETELEIYLNDRIISGTSNVRIPIFTVTIVIMDGNHSSEDSPVYSPYIPGLKNAYFQGLRSTGRNLIPYTYSDSTKTENGVTFTVNDDGSLTANGNSTSAVLFSFTSSQTFTLPAGTYFFSGNSNKSLSDSTLFCSINKYRSGVFISGVAADYGAGVSFTVTDEDVSLRSCYVIGVYIPYANFSVDGYVFRPMLNYGSSALPYEPYVSHEISLDTAIELPAWDSINPTTGKRTVGTNTIYLDEIDDWNIGANQYEGKTAFHKGGFPNIVVYNSSNPQAICSRLPFSYSSATNITPGEAYSIARTTSAIYISIFNSRLSSLDSAGLKAYFTQERNAGNPYVVSYIIEPTEADISMENRLPAYKNGSETVTKGDTDNSEDGQENTLTPQH